jgi:hypothetical protein
LHQTFFLLTVNGRFLFDVSKRKWGFKGSPCNGGDSSLCRETAKLFLRGETPHFPLQAVLAITKER